MKSLIFGVSPTDPVTFVSVAVLLAASGICRLLDPRAERFARGSDGGVAS